MKKGFTAACQIKDLSAPALSLRRNGGWERLRLDGFAHANPSATSTPSVGLLSQSACALSSSFAFTLAEVLITLTIIGVVAAMTIPTVVRNYQETQTIAQLKKVQTSFEQAVSGARLKYGPVATWGVVDGSDESTAQVVSYLKPYLKIIRDCGNTPGCWSEQNTKTLNGGQLSSINNRTGGNEYAITLVDGVNVNFDVYTQGDNVLGVNLDRDTLSLFVDVNGNKKPNTLGRDVFVFFIKTPGEIVPAGVDNSSANCKKTSSGIDCAAKVLKEGKINYLK